MRTSGESADTIDAHEACDDCDFEGGVDLTLNHATGLTHWECPNGHGHTGETSP